MLTKTPTYLLGYVIMKQEQYGVKVENYLTLVGGNREIELGSFLSPEERSLVRVKIENMLRKINS